MNPQTHPGLWAPKPVPVPVKSESERRELLAACEPRMHRNLKRDDDIKRQQREADEQARWQRYLLARELGDDFNLIRAHKLHALKNGDSVDRFCETRFSKKHNKDVGVELSQLYKYGDIASGFPLEWAREAPCRASIEVSAAIGGSGLASFVNYELWTLRRDKGCPEPVMKDIIKAVRQWFGGLGPEDPPPTAEQVAAYIRARYQELKKDEPKKQAKQKLGRLNEFVEGMSAQLRSELGQDAELQEGLHRLLRNLQAERRDTDRCGPAGPVEEAPDPGESVSSVSTDTGTTPTDESAINSSVSTDTGNAPAPQAQEEEHFLLAPIRAVKAVLSPEELKELGRHLGLALAGRDPLELICFVRGVMPRLSGASAEVRSELSDWLREIARRDLETRWHAIYNFFILCEPPGFVRRLHSLRCIPLPESLHPVLEAACDFYPLDPPLDLPEGASPVDVRARRLQQKIKVFLEIYQDLVDSEAEVCVEAAANLWVEACDTRDELERLLPYLPEEGAAG